MAATASTMLPLGTIAPDFALLDVVSNQLVTLQALRGEKATLLMFICNHCPYVLHVKTELIALANQYSQRGVTLIAISSNDIAQYPEDAPDKMQALMQAWGNPFAGYLFDETQAVAKAYQAACTPDFYLFDADLSCVYRGRLDGSTPKNAVPVTGAELRQALDAVLAHQSPIDPQFPSIGCNIKWKPFT